MFIKVSFGRKKNLEKNGTATRVASAAANILNGSAPLQKQKKVKGLSVPWRYHQIEVVRKIMNHTYTEARTCTYIQKKKTRAHLHTLTTKTGLFPQYPW